MQYVCKICGYVYDDDKEKVPFNELPDSWKCPLCGASKSDFKAVGEAKAEPSKPTVKPIVESDDVKLSVGQLSALCSNLARGCEKQYNEEAAGLFRQLSDYFASITPEVNDYTVERLAEELRKDCDNYPGVRAVADEASDRGAARVCVWGEKVTNMLSSLVERYLKDGEIITEGKEVWVCTICGFVYIGKNPPALCPVCKVPDWKFEKIEGSI